MRVSSANMTLSMAESLQRRGYVVECEADDEYVNITKPEKLEYWHDEEVVA